MKGWWFDQSLEWPTRPLYSVADEVSRKNLGLVEANVLSLSYGSIKRRDVDSGMGLLPESFETYNRIETGDLVMRLTDLQNDKRSLRTGLVGEPGIITSAYTTLRFRLPMDWRFGHYYLHALDTLKVFYQMGGGVRQSLKFDDIRRMPVPLPSPSVQQLIADFLDRETDRIDALIGAKRRLIDLLAEKRTALITHAVTKGLDPSVQMKDSDIPWIGEIPAHWEVRSLKFIAHMKSGLNITSDDISDSGPYPVYGGNGLRGYATTFTHEGDFVLIGRQGALSGNINYASGKFHASEHAVVADLTGGQTTYWLGELLRAMNLNQYSQASAQPGISVDVISGLRAPVPPLQERVEIERFMQRRVSVSNSVDELLTGQLDLLTEYRQALITAAVTGHLDEETLKERKSADEAMAVEIPS